ncbi:hypothetical protein XfCFBP8356_011745 [Xylella fastidiosa subsp. sandyi]|uniref:hypothetical protein n=1 Tax=Xylella fastidiosa TaxID=2371 RepID=UPI0007071F39|nr:hypothetical protein [Xylella fastidiosa]KQH74863.1 hypothetical protein AOT81_00940 [Xylella fastidiosa]RWA45504.1 hypothetical protein XfCFBP8356_00420 [Xylella fastidiosa subsp. sandyi]WNY18924.1 hypothetical protein RO839_10780 [Xylella fastidiosa]WNY21212.1 hypothetical protein RO838_10800 [Xylella fastidiosa]
MPVPVFLQSNHFRYLFEPRKPRHPIARLMASTAGLTILIALVFFSVFVGAAMVLGGVAWKLLVGQRRRTRAEVGTQTIEGKYRVIHKPDAPL